MRPKLNLYLINSIITFVCFSCQHENIIQQVSEYYSSDKNKSEAAVFLVNNMSNHYSIHNPAVDSLTKRLQLSDSIVDTEKLEKWWMELSRYNNPQKKLDIDTVSFVQIISEVDKAFDIWQKSPWRKEVSFYNFSRYILPYRVLNENISFGWRDSLYAKYSHLIKPNMSLKDAFLTIHNAINKKIKKTKSTGLPYLLNALEMKNINKAECLQCCLYECYVMRALGIPVAIDGVMNWANYGIGGHSWIALIGNDEIITFNRESRRVGSNNPIDATVFKIDSLIEPDYQYKTDFKKRCSKIWRFTYENFCTNYDDAFADSDTRNLFMATNIKDVSSQYKLNMTIKYKAISDYEYAYLCTYKTDKGWIPVEFSKKKDDFYTFTNMGDSIVYMLMAFQEGELIPISRPFKVTNGLKTYLKPELHKTRKIILNRKYPLIGHFLDIWSDMKGLKIEGSNHPNFKNCEILYTLNRTPIFRNVAQIHNRKPFQYIRLQMPEKGVVPLAEIEFWNQNQQIKGEQLGALAENIDRCFDSDLFTTIKNQKPGYYVGLNLGKPTIIDRIVFYPKNDGNFVIPNDIYELFYFDKSWVSLGVKKSSSFDLTYDSVPQNSLLLLKDLTTGNEERIFTYESCQQIWW